MYFKDFETYRQSAFFKLQGSSLACAARPLDTHEMWSSRVAGERELEAGERTAEGARVCVPPPFRYIDALRWCTMTTQKVQKISYKTILYYLKAGGRAVLCIIRIILYYVLIRIMYC